MLILIGGIYFTLCWNNQKGKECIFSDEKNYYTGIYLLLLTNLIHYTYVFATCWCHISYINGNSVKLFTYIGAAV